MNYAAEKQKLAAEYGERIQAAKQRQQEVLDCAFVDLSPSIVGIPIRHVTLSDLPKLEAAQSPFFGGGKSLSAADVLKFLWIMSPEFSHSAFRRWRWIRKHSGIEVVTAASEIQDYVESVFEGESGKSGESGSDDSGPKVSFVASIVDMFANEYGWSLKEVLTAPLCQLLQLKRVIVANRTAAAGKKMLWLSGEADSLMAEYLEQLNEIEAQEAVAMTRN